MSLRQGRLLDRHSEPGCWSDSAGRIRSSVRHAVHQVALCVRTPGSGSRRSAHVAVRYPRPRKVTLRVYSCLFGLPAVQGLLGDSQASILPRVSLRADVDSTAA